MDASNEMDRNEITVGVFLNRVLKVYPKLRCFDDDGNINLELATALEPATVSSQSSSSSSSSGESSSQPTALSQPTISTQSSQVMLECEVKYDCCNRFVVLEPCGHLRCCLSCWEYWRNTCIAQGNSKTCPYCNTIVTDVRLPYH